MAFISTIRSLLEASKHDELLAVFSNPESRPHIEANGMDVIQLLCQEGLLSSNNPEVCASCSKALVIVSKIARPKEALIILLEQAETLQNSPHFIQILQPLKNVMLQMPKKRTQTLSWVLSILNSHRAFHVIPCHLKNKLYKGYDDILTFEHDPKVQDILYAYKEFYSFYETFVNEYVASTENGEGDRVRLNEQKIVLQSYLMHLLGPPLLNMELGWSDPEKLEFDARRCARDLFSLLTKLGTNPSYWIDWIERTESVDHWLALKAKEK